MLLLTEFLLRLTLGMAVGMAFTSPRQVASGYFRNNLYVTLGLASLAALLCRALGSDAFWYAFAVAIVSYAGAVCWLYEKQGLGRCLLVLAAALTLPAAVNTGLSRAELVGEEVLDRYVVRATEKYPITPTQVEKLGRRAYNIGMASGFLGIASVVTSGLLLGVTMAAMLLGHWYLNSPTMQLAPLRRLLILIACATAMQTIVCTLGLAGELATAKSPPLQWQLFVALRWLFGLIGVAILTWMAWRTLAIPNAQSATGILYVAVIGVFVGETMSLLLSAESIFPL